MTSDDAPVVDICKSIYKTIHDNPVSYNDKLPTGCGGCIPSKCGVRALILLMFVIIINTGSTKIIQTHMLIDAV